MTTITAKELRDNLETYVKRTSRGESIKVTYRTKPAFILQPVEPVTTVSPGSKEAMKNFVNKTRTLRISKNQPNLDPNKSTKELYQELLMNDPKYNPPYSQ
ncbi:MAG: type II toxin-antitoxin system prevent-host-death family antitoxin [Patescibacteria group bacterium]